MRHAVHRESEVARRGICKKQQMAWTKAGAQVLLHFKTAMLNGALHRYTRHTELAAAAAYP